MPFQRADTRVNRISSLRERARNKSGTFFAILGKSGTEMEPSSEILDYTKSGAIVESVLGGISRDMNSANTIWNQ